MWWSGQCRGSWSTGPCRPTGAGPKRVRELAKQTGGVGGENALADAVAKVNRLYDMRAAKLNQVLNKPAIDISKMITPFVEAVQKGQMDLQNFSAGVYEATRTPLELYERQLDRLDSALKAGTLDWDTYGRAVAMAKEQLEAASKVDMPESPGYRPTAAIERGSLEDITARIQGGLNSAMNPNGQNNRDVKDTARSTKESAQTLRGMDDTLKDMLHELNQQQRIQVVSIM